MIERTHGSTTGYGYLVGSGYEGATEALDKAIEQIASSMEQRFKRDIEIRFNSNQRSGGAFIQDNDYSHQLGVCGYLTNHLIENMTPEEIFDLSQEEQREKYPDDTIKYYYVLNESLRNNPDSDKHERYGKADEAFAELEKAMDTDAVNKYLDSCSA